MIRKLFLPEILYLAEWFLVSLVFYLIYIFNIIIKVIFPLFNG